MSQAITCPSTHGSLTLFKASHTSNSMDVESFKLYSFKVWDNGILKGYFVPCKNAEGKVGLYNYVNSTFYGNAGTGSFVYG